MEWMLKQMLKPFARALICGVIKGLFTWREEDPRLRNNFSFGLHAEISAESLA